MKLSWQLVYFFLYCYRCIISIIADLFVSRITPLGDNDTYLTRSIETQASSGGLGVHRIFEAPRQFSTELTVAIAYYLKSFFGLSLLVNIAFQTIAFIGIISVLRALDPYHRKWLLFLLILPSFTIWSSIAGKEAIVVFAVGIASAYLINFSKKKRLPNIQEIISAILIGIYKLQFLPAFLFLYFTLLIGDKVKQKTSIILFAGLLSLSSLYIAKDKFDYITLVEIPKSFINNYTGKFQFSGNDGLAGGRSTRNIFFEEKGDFFWNIPKGFTMSLIGPTYKEVFRDGNPVHIFGFVEGMIILIFLSVAILYNSKKSPAILVIAVLFTFFWILFGTYPLGVMNPGTAIRYRTSVIPFLGILAIYFISNKASYNWLKTRR